MENLSLIISGIVVLIIGWAMILTHAKTLKSHVVNEWQKLHDLLLLRHDYLPSLVETVRELTQGQEAVIQKVIEKRSMAMHLDDVNLSKVTAELELVQAANEMMGLTKEFPELGRHTNFLETRAELELIKRSIHEQTDRYNDMVRRYNRFVKSILFSVFCFPFGLRREHVFTSSQ